MNVEDRINKIKSVEQEICKDIELRSQGVAVVRQNYIDHISTYKDRIADLLTVAKCLYNSCGQLRDLIYQFSPYGKLGFITENSLWGDTNGNIKIGYVDGHEGTELFTVNENLEVTYSPRMSNYSRYNWDKDFERFERKFYNYIDNEI